MTAPVSSHPALAVIEPAFTEAERLALAGFLAGYSGITREAYTLDLRQFTAWCHRRHLALFAVRRADIELFARDLEAARRARGTITRRLSTIAGLHKYAVEEDLPDHSPAAHVRRPRIDHESHAAALGSQRGRRAAGRRRARHRRRARLDLAARPQRAAGIRGHRRRHRSPPHRTRPPDPGHHPQGQQEGPHPARAPHRPRDRPGHRRTLRGTNLHHLSWRAAHPDGAIGPARASRWRHRRGWVGRYRAPGKARPKANRVIRSPIAGRLRGTYTSGVGFGRLSSLKLVSGGRSQFCSMNFRIETWSL